MSVQVGGTEKCQTGTWHTMVPEFEWDFTADRPELEESHYIATPMTRRMLGIGVKQKVCP